MRPTSTQSNFCRLIRITEEQYQNALFETGYLYAELYWSKNLPSNWQELACIMRKTKEYWKWWSTQWNIRTQEAFGVVGINENEKQISIEESDALFEAFMDSHQLNSFDWVYPNKLVFMAFNKKISHEKCNNNSRKRTREKSTITIQGNTTLKTHYL